MDVVTRVEVGSASRGRRGGPVAGYAGEVDHRRDVGHREVADPDATAPSTQRTAAPTGRSRRAGGRSRRRPRPRRPRSAGKNAATAISSWRSARLQRADVEVAGGDGAPSARPARRRASRRAGRAPPASRRPRRRARASRPWCRGCGWSACATCASAMATSGCTRPTSAEASTSACRASAPTRDAGLVGDDRVQAGQPVDVDEQRAAPPAAWRAAGPGSGRRPAPWPPDRRPGPPGRR